ncbi:MAG: DUF488 domain-containing protein [Caldilineaceae bacterium]
MEQINPMATHTIYTVGHSNHTSEKFIALLKQHAVACLVDVRSQPYSRYNPHFNRETLAAALRVEGIQYIDMGSSLGGRPDQKDLYDPGQERPNYHRQRQTEQYQAGIAGLTKQAQQITTAIMCSEGNPHECHRGEWLITPDLIDAGFTVQHILPDGVLEMGEKVFEQLGFGF